MAVTSAGASGPRILEHFHCIGCDFQVLVCDDYVWNDDAEYMFFRNNYPNFDKRNCELGKVLLASGLQMASVALPETFVVALLRAEIWQHQMSSYMAYAAIGINSVAVIFGGPFGRFSDIVDRRLAAAVFAIGTFAPTWSLLIFGHTTSKALWISTIVKVGDSARNLFQRTCATAQVLGSYGLTSNVMLALINDVTHPKDREEAVGLYFAANNLMSLTMTGIPVLLVLILRVIPNNPIIFLVVQVVLSTLCLLLLCSVRWKRKEPNEEVDVDDSDSEDVPSSTSARLCAIVEPAYKRQAAAGAEEVQFILPIRLAFGNRRLRRLWCAGFMLMFSGQLVMDIGGQYFNQSMDLIPYGTKNELTTVAVLTMIPGQLLAIPGNLVTGYLSKRGGPLYLLRRLVPIASMLVTLGAFMAEVKQFWFIALTVIFLNYASLPNVPLMRLVAGLAPPGRVGESLTAIGIAAQLASLIGNAAVVFINHKLMQTDMANPLWIYYPMCGTLTLMAILPIQGTPYGGWGAASGLREDQMVAIVYAHVAQQRWRKLVARCKAARAAS
eukprot:g24092.t1